MVKVDLFSKGPGWLSQEFKVIFKPQFLPKVLKKSLANKNAWESGSHNFQKCFIMSKEVRTWAAGMS